MRISHVLLLAFAVLAAAFVLYTALHKEPDAPFVRPTAPALVHNDTGAPVIPTTAPTLMHNDTGAPVTPTTTPTLVHNDTGAPVIPTTAPVQQPPYTVTLINGERSNTLQLKFSAPVSPSQAKEYLIAELLSHRQGKTIIGSAWDAQTKVIALPDETGKNQLGLVWRASDGRVISPDEFMAGVLHNQY